MNVRLLLSALLLASIDAPSLSAQQVETHDLPPGARMRLGSYRYRVSDWTKIIAPNGKYEVWAQGKRYIVRDLAMDKDLFDLEIPADPSDWGMRREPCAFTEDGEGFIEVGRRRVVLRELPSGKIKQSVDIPEGELAKHPVPQVCGNSVLLSYQDEKFKSTGRRVWNHATNELSPSLRIMGSLYAKISPGGTRIAVPGDEIVVHRVDNSQKTATIDGGIGGMLLFANERILIVQPRRGAVEAYDADTGNHLRSYFGCRLAFGACASGDGKLRVNDPESLFTWDLESGKLLEKRKLPWEYYRPIAIREQGVLYRNAKTNSVRFWDSAKGKWLFVDENPVTIHGAVRFVSARQLQTFDGMGGSRVWDIEAGKVASTTKVKNNPWDFSPDGKLGVCATPDYQFVFDSENDRPFTLFEENYRESCLLDRGRIAYFVGYHLHVLDCFTQAIVAKFDLKGLIPRFPERLSKERAELRYVCVTSDLNRLACIISRDAPADDETGAPQTFLRIIDLRSRKTVFERSVNNASPILASPEGSLFVVRTAEHLLFLDAKSAIEKQRIPWDNGADFGQLQFSREVDAPSSQRDIAKLGVFSPNGKTFAISPERRFPEGPPVVHIFELATGRVRAKLTGHRGDIYDLAFAPDGKTLASASKDTTVLIWNVGPHAKPGKFDADGLWRELGQRDAGKAYEAMCVLAGHAEAAIGLCAGRLPVVRATFTEADLGRWIGELEQGEFAVRAKAEQELRKIARLATPALRKRLDEAKALETQKRLEKLLSLVDGNEFTDDELRAIRAVELVESIAKENARDLLRRWSQGHAAAVLTIEATKALKRLESAP